MSQLLPAPVSTEVARALVRLSRTDGVRRIAVMPDVHLARQVCIGTVVGAGGRLFPEAVGGDIGCGMAALRFACDADVVDRRDIAGGMLAFWTAHVPTMQHRSAGASLPDELADRPLSAPRLERAKRRTGRVQLGTLGRGNHFVELQRDEAGALWVMVHSGSRGMGQAIRDHHLTFAASTNTGMAYLDADSARGADYLSDLAWALDYARENRRVIARQVAAGLAEILGVEADEDTYVDCHHNFARSEDHGDGALWVHRKGAISARAGEPGIIPGSMGSASFHVTGRGVAASMWSSSHGAGRVMSRAQARHELSVAALHDQMAGVWFDHRLASRLRDEAPAAYKDIGQVMRAQRELTRIERRLRPVVVYKGT